jgi:hypothetical protein
VDRGPSTAAAGVQNTVVTLSGSAVYAAAGTYTCNANDASTAGENPMTVTYTSGTSFTLTTMDNMNGADTLNWFCIGY